MLSNHTPFTSIVHKELITHGTFTIYAQPPFTLIYGERKKFQLQLMILQISNIEKSKQIKNSSNCIILYLIPSMQEIHETKLFLVNIYMGPLHFVSMLCQLET